MTANHVKEYLDGIWMIHLLYISYQGMYLYHPSIGLGGIKKIYLVILEWVNKNTNQLIITDTLITMIIYNNEHITKDLF